MPGPRMSLAAACLAASAALAPAAADDGLEQARRNYPALILGGNVRAIDGADERPRACPSRGRVEQRGGPTFEYLGADPATPDLCRMRIGGQPAEGWFGIWLTAWPGAGMAHAAMSRLVRGRTGNMEAFSVRPA